MKPVLIIVGGLILLIVIILSFSKKKDDGAQTVSVASNISIITGQQVAGTLNVLGYFRIHKP
jgi:hypothetical protein